jgi:hypothetical protein
MTPIIYADICMGLVAVAALWILALALFTDKFRGPKGDQGDSIKGDKGDKGNAGTITIGEVITVAFGFPASVENLGTPQAAILQISIPHGPQGPRGDSIKGDRGSAATISIGSVMASESGSDPLVVNVGTDTDAIFDFTLPRGPAGEIIKLYSAGQRAQERYEMLDHGRGTGHTFTRDHPHYQKCLDTPGLSIRNPDGTIDEGNQGEFNA